MDVLLPECRHLYPGLKFANRIKHLRQAFTLSEDAASYLQEILKFLGTLALIMTTALIMLMAG